MNIKASGFYFEDMACFSKLNILIMHMPIVSVMNFTCGDSARRPGHHKHIKISLAPVGLKLEEKL